MASNSLALDDDDDTKSLTDSITDYPVTWGRRYHKYKEGAYVLPNDDIESDRLDLQYEALKMLHDDKIYFAPLKNPRRILDIGTGTGIWAIEMAALFPNARITGTDLSPIQPSLVPPRVSFEIQDCTEADWCRPLASLDHIHTSIMLGCLPSYRALMENAFPYLKPGTAWLECHEILPEICCDDNTVPPDWPLRTWHDYLEEGARKMDGQRPIRVADKLASWMRDVGYLDVQEHVDKIPLNPWPKDPFLKHIGRLWEVTWLDGLSAFSYKVFGPEGLGWSQNEIEVFLVDVRKCIRDRNAHAYQKIYVVYGRRPSEEEKKERRGKESNAIVPSAVPGVNGGTPKRETSQRSPTRNDSDQSPVFGQPSATCSYYCDPAEQSPGVYYSSSVHPST